MGLKGVQRRKPLIISGGREQAREYLGKAVMLEPEKDCRAEEKGRRESVTKCRRQECAWSRESLRKRGSGSADRSTDVPAKGPCFIPSTLKSLGGPCGF